jgi:hypothetical protein
MTRLAKGQRIYVSIFSISCTNCHGSSIGIVEMEYDPCCPKMEIFLDKIEERIDAEGSRTNIDPDNNPWQLFYQPENISVIVSRESFDRVIHKYYLKCKYCKKSNMIGSFRVICCRCGFEFCSSNYK